MKASPASLLLSVWVLLAGGSPIYAQSDHLQRAVELMQSGDLPGAEKEARLVSAGSSDRAAALETLGSICIREKKYQQAITALSAAVKLDPHSARVRAALAEAYLGAGNKSLAKQAYKEALLINADDPLARMGLAQLEASAGNFAGSLRLLDSILAQVRRSPEGIVLLARDYMGLKDRDSLAALVTDWKQLSDQRAEPTVDFSSLLVKSGLNSQALEVLESAKSHGQVSENIALQLADLHFLAGELDDAFSGYAAALSLNPECLKCLQQLANISERRKNPEAALSYSMKAKHIQPGNPDILFAFGKACLELDLIDDALPALQKAAQLRAKNDSFHYVLASAHVAKKQYLIAENEYRQLLAKHPDDPVLNYALGSVLFLEVKLDAAAEYLHKSVRENPDQSAAYYYLALIDEGKGQNEQALTRLRELTKRYPDYTPAYEALGGLLLKQQKFSDAQQILEKAIAMDPKSTKAHYQYGMLLGRLGKHEQSEQEFDIVKKLNAEEGARAGMQLRLLNPH